VSSPVRPGGILGFEAAGTGEALGDEVDDVVVGDDVAVHLPKSVGGYAELVVAGSWIRKPTGLSWPATAALPAPGSSG
jgi:NADPH:quinone reductase-like Zn-dependent oxidoreductase